MWYQHSPVVKGGLGGVNYNPNAREQKCSGDKLVLFSILTCRVLLGNGPSVEHRSVPGDGPHLTGSTDGDGLEGLVGAHVQPGAALEEQRRLVNSRILNE